MPTVPPIVIRATHALRSATTLFLVSLLVAGCASAALFPHLGWLPAPIQVAACFTWCVAVGAVLGLGVRRLMARNRWALSVLRAQAESQLARQLEDRIERCGELEPGTYPALATIRRLALRIDGLAGDRMWILEMTRTARATASRLDEERRAVGRMNVPSPALSELETSLKADLEAHHQRLILVLDRLVSEHSAAGIDILDDGLSRLDAESEVLHSSRALASVHHLRPPRADVRS